MKVLVADDHAIMREGLLNILSRVDSDNEIIEAASYSEVNDALQRHSDFSLLLIDLSMPGDDNLIEVNKILHMNIICPLIVMSASEDPKTIQMLFDLGVSGYIPKSETNNVLVSAIKLVLEGGVYIPTQLLNLTTDRSDKQTGAENSKSSITRRQKEVLNLLAQGKSNKEIGNILGLAEGTVRTHLVTVFRILGVQNRTQAGIRARELGHVE